MASAWLYTLVPAGAAVLGAVVATCRPPGPRTVSAIQHFAAGVVFAAAATEILPDVKHQGAALPVAIGGAIGVALMLLVRALSERAAGGIGLAAVIGVDVLIDGIVLGLGFAAGAEQGVLLTLALTLEVLFLGLSATGELSPTLGSPGRTILAIGGLALLLPIGALLGTPAAALPPAWQTGLFAFALIALLYLVTEELLVEAHEVPDTPWITAMFFAGFLILLLLEEVAL